jgi:hypothetical protein
LSRDFFAQAAFGSISEPAFLIETIPAIWGDAPRFAQLAADCSLLARVVLALGTNHAIIASVIEK